MLREFTLCMSRVLPEFAISAESESSPLTGRRAQGSEPTQQQHMGERRETPTIGNTLDGIADRRTSPGDIEAVIMRQAADK